MFTHDSDDTTPTRFVCARPPRLHRGMGPGHRQSTESLLRMSRGSAAESHFYPNYTGRVFRHLPVQPIRSVVGDCQIKPRVCGRPFITIILRKNCEMVFKYSPQSIPNVHRYQERNSFPLRGVHFHRKKVCLPAPHRRQERFRGSGQLPPPESFFPLMGDTPATPK